MVSFLSVSTGWVSNGDKYSKPLDDVASLFGEVPVDKARKISPEKLRPAAWPPTFREELDGIGGFRLR